MQVNRVLIVVALSAVIVVEVWTLAYYFHAVASENRSLQAASTLPKIESMWHCDGWAGVKYQTIEHMRKAVK